MVTEQEETKRDAYKEAMRYMANAKKSSFRPQTSSNLTSAAHPSAWAGSLIQNTSSQSTAAPHI